MDSLEWALPAKVVINPIKQSILKKGGKGKKLAANEQQGILAGEASTTGYKLAAGNRCANTCLPKEKKGGSV